MLRQEAEALRNAGEESENKMNKPKWPNFVVFSSPRN